MGLVIFDEAQKIWHSTSLQGSSCGLPAELGAYKRLLEVVQPGDSYYFIFNVRTSAFEFISTDCAQVLGYEANAVDISFFLSLIHPDDQPYFLNFELAVQEFMHGLPGDKAMKYKIRYDFRIRHRQQQYIRLLHQMVIYQHSEGQVHKTLGIHTDITHLKEKGKPVISFLGMDGEPSYINVEVHPVHALRKNILSQRECEIVCALADGLQSKEIADRLFITKTTVDKHRRNMLTKTNTASTAELVAKAIREGWI